MRHVFTEPRICGICEDHLAPHQTTCPYCDAVTETLADRCDRLWARRDYRAESRA